MSEMRKIAGRPRAYTPDKLKKAVNRYFSSISRERAIVEKIPDGYTEDGKEKYKIVPVLNALGEEAKEIQYLTKPSVAGLCAFLHIHRDTWASYCRSEEYKSITDAVKTEIEAYLCSQLGNGKGDTGIIFNLTHNYGWKNRIEIDAGAETRKAMTEDMPRTMADKIRFLKEHGYNVPEIEGNADGE